MENKFKKFTQHNVVHVGLFGAASQTFNHNTTVQTTCGSTFPITNALNVVLCFQNTYTPPSGTGLVLNMT